jgi:16S rRNA (guanine966-N2)-methyltransferase
MKILKGFYKGVEIAVPIDGPVRPTVDHLKKNIFTLAKKHCPSPQIVWDLFAGSGGVGLEFLSRGARCVVFVERLNKALSCLRLNLGECGIRNSESFASQKTSVVAAPVEDFLITPEKFGGTQQPDLVFLDPPYGQGWMKKIVPQLAACRLVGPKTFFIAEHVTDDPFENTSGAIIIQREIYGPKVLTCFQCPVLDK